MVATINRNAFYILRWLTKSTYQLRKFVKPRELQVMFEKEGFIVQDTTGVAVNPINRQMFTTKSTLVNYMVTTVQPA